MSQSRVKQSIKNSQINLLGYFATTLLGFFSRKIFLDYLGTDFIGLTGTLANVLGFLNLAELGFSVAVAYTLYKPLYDEDRHKICEIISLFQTIYRRVGTVIGALGLLFSCFIPFIFRDRDVDLILVYASFWGLLLSSLIGYFVNYRQLLLTADQKNYIVAGYFQLSRIVKSLFQIAAAYYYRDPYIWIIMECAFSAWYSWILNRKITQHYPWLRRIGIPARELFKRYPDILSKAKQVFVHRLKDVLLTQSDQILIFCFVSLSMVAYYGNYMMVISSLTTLCLTALDSMSASVGNLVAENNKKYIKNVFWQLISLRYFVSGILVFGVFYYIDPLIFVWLGGQYILDRDVVCLMIAVMAILTSRGVVDMFNAAYGNFADTWAAWVEGSINLVVSIVCAYQWGIIGLLYGKLASLIPIILLWKPIYLYRSGFKTSCRAYFIRIILYVSVFAVSCFIGSFMKLKITQAFLPDETASLFSLLFNFIPNILIFILVYFALLSVSFEEFRELVRRAMHCVIKTRA